MDELNRGAPAGGLCADQAELERLRALFPAERGPLRILDAGGGRLALLLGRLGHQVVEADLSPAASLRAREAEEDGGRAEPLPAGCQSLPFPDESFDGVVSGGAVRCLPDSAAYREWYRVLRRGGLLAVRDRAAGGGPLSDTSARPRRDVELLRELGFAHCRAEAAPEGAGFWITAHKPASAGRMHIPQLTQYNRYLRAAKSQLQLYNNWCAANGLSYAEFMVLHMATHHAKGVRPSDISSALVIPRQTLTRILAGLEKRGDVERSVNESDRRSALIRITPAGRERFHSLHSRLHQAEQQALSRFTVEDLSRFADFSEGLLEAYAGALQGPEEA